ncbi:MAG: sulfonate ABC transporter substrate-binding protein, partial [Microcystis panniformis]
PIYDRSLTALQQHAHIIRDLKIIPHRVNVRYGTYTLQTKQNWTY